MGDVVLLTDSCCDLPAEVLEAARVAYVPLSYILDDAEHPDDLGQTMPYEAFYARLESGATATTTQVPVVRYLEAFERLTASGHTVVYLAVSSAISGCYDASVIAREQFMAEHPDARIACVDSKCAAAGQGLLVLAAAEQAAAGMDADELVRWIESQRSHVNHVFTVGSFEHLVRGGRVSPAVGKVGSLLNIKPILTVDGGGALAVLQKPRGRHHALEMTAKLVAERLGGVDRSLPVYLSHGDCPEDAEAMRTLLEERCGLTDVRMGRVGTVIGAHTGPGVLVVCFRGEPRG